ncbi:MAG TPA: hypothetical protein VF575_00935 [Candidatus Saccharimonadales bacterium]
MTEQSYPTHEYITALQELQVSSARITSENARIDHIRDTIRQSRTGDILGKPFMVETYIALG